MRKIALIGSTGSIGRQVLNVVKSYPDRFSLCALAAFGSGKELTEQVNAFGVPFAALAGKKGAKPADMPARTAFFGGTDGALKMIDECGADVVFVACGGFAGLKYALKAVDTGKFLALANKEALVCGGELLTPRLEKIAPVDSEHSAIWQCLAFDRFKKVKNLIITASGGPFRGRKFEELDGVTAAQALAHPTWKMGRKITVDSATLLNKGYEVIEAHHLYGTPYENIKTVIQPQSIIHSMVEFDDGSYLAQMSNPTMELPIQLALTYPERLPVKSLSPLDFSKPFSLGFEPLSRKDYPLYDLAIKCGEEGGTLPTALNAAGEVAVQAFLDGKIKFTDIFRVTEKVVSGHTRAAVKDYGQLEEADLAARASAEMIIKR